MSDDWATSLSLFTFQFHALEKEMATHSSVLAWKIPGMREPGGLPSMGSHRVGHDWCDLAAAAVCLKLTTEILTTEGIINRISGRRYLHYHSQGLQYQTLEMNRVSRQKSVRIKLKPSETKMSQFQTSVLSKQLIICWEPNATLILLLLLLKHR